MDNIEIGQNIKNARIAKKISQSELAKMVNSSKSVINRIEQGIITDWGLVIKIHNALGMNSDYILKTRENVDKIKYMLIEDDNDLELYMLHEELKKIKKEKKSRSKIVTGIIILIISLTLANIVTYAAYNKSFFEFIREEVDYLVFWINKDGDSSYDPDEEMPMPYYFDIPVYQPSDICLKVDYTIKSGKTKIMFATDEEQEYSVEIREADKSSTKYAKGYLNKYKQTDIVIDSQIVTLYYDGDKALFVLDELLYVFYEYDFDMDQLISIIENMEKQMIK